MKIKEKPLSVGKKAKNYLAIGLTSALMASTATAEIPYKNQEENAIKNNLGQYKTELTTSQTKKDKKDYREKAISIAKRKVSNLESEISRADSITNSVEEKFNKCLDKGKLDYETMKVGLEKLEKSEKIYDNIRSRAKRMDLKPYENVSLDSQYKDLKSSYKRTIDGWDWGQAELEKRLKSKGHEIEVDNPLTCEDIGHPAILSLIGGSIAFSIIGFALTGRGPGDDIDEIRPF